MSRKLRKTTTVTVRLDEEATKKIRLYKVNNDYISLEIAIIELIKQTNYD